MGLLFQVLTIVKHSPGLEKISFVGHSLGGLIARYAIAKLYEPSRPRTAFEENGYHEDPDNSTTRLKEGSEGKIAGLEPVNFVTFATPHVGSRWHRQVRRKYFVFV